MDGDRARGSFESEGTGAGTTEADDEAVVVRGTFEADLQRNAITA